MRALSAKVIRSGYVSEVFLITASLFICIFAGVSDISAQKKKAPQKKQASIKEVFTNLSDICIPPNTDYISVLQIDSEAKATLTTQTNTGSRVLFDVNMTASAADALTAVFDKPTVTVKADPSLKFDLVVKILKGARQALDRCFNVEASTHADDPYVYIFPEPKEANDLPVYPNPLLLVVRLDQNADITLNNERQGSLNDTSALEIVLERVFKERENDGVFRRGTNVVEKTVRLKAVPTARFGDIVKIVDALKQAGASPVGLQIDEVGSCRRHAIGTTKALGR